MKWIKAQIFWSSYLFEHKFGFSADDLQITCITERTGSQLEKSYRATC